MVDKVHGFKKALGRKVIISGRSVNWWDEELGQLVKYRRTCLPKVKVKTAIGTII